MELIEKVGTTECKNMCSLCICSERSAHLFSLSILCLCRQIENNIERPVLCSEGLLCSNYNRERGTREMVYCNKASITCGTQTHIPSFDRSADTNSTLSWAKVT